MTDYSERRVNLTGAARAAGVTTQTLLRWRTESERAEPRVGRADLFQAGEFETTDRRIGGGAEWSLSLAAVERVHRARGGVTFYAEAALGGGRVSAAARVELEALRARVVEMEQELARLRRSATTTERSSLAGVSPDTATQAAPPRAPRLPATPRAPRPRSTPDGPVEHLPDGWVAVSTFAQRLGVDHRAYERYIESGRWPQPHVGRWTRGGPNLILYAWDTDQQAQIIALIEAQSAKAASAPTLAPTNGPDKPA